MGGNGYVLSQAYFASFVASLGRNCWDVLVVYIYVLECHIAGT